MKHQIWSMTVLSLFLLATGCGVGGFWMTGTIQALVKISSPTYKSGKR